MLKIIIIWLGVLIFCALAGCAVSYRDVAEMKESKTNASEAQLKKAASQLKQERTLTLMSGNFLGDMPIDLPYAATLPPIFFENIFIRQKGSSYGTVAQAAKNISLATGLSVWTNPDVEATIATSAAAGAAGTPKPGGSGVPLGLPLPAPSGPGVPSSANSTTMTPGEILANKQNLIRLDYRGQLLNYVNQVAISGGINWEYRDGGIYFFRMITKIFTLSNITPGQVNVSDGMSKGGNASAGVQAGASSSSSGEFANTSSVEMRGAYSVWKDVLASLDAAKSPAGKVAISEATGTVTVTDTKEAINRIEKIINHENELMGRQVAVDVRVIKVGLNNNTQAGFDLNAVYTTLAGNTLGLFGPSTNTTIATGSMVFKVNDPNSPFSSSSPIIRTLNQFGTIASDSTSTLITTNRMPTMTGAFNTTGFLAGTTPATGGGTSGGAGVPGLTGGYTTTGSFLRLTPTIKDNNTVLLSLSIDLSALLGIGSATTGQGQTFQQIQWANTDGTKSTSNILLNQNEAMVMIGIGDEGINSQAGNALGGASANATKTKNLFVIIVTPRILRGI